MKKLTINVASARPVVQALTKVWTRLGVLITGQGPNWLTFKPSTLMLKDIEHLLTLDYKKAKIESSGWASKLFSKNGKDVEYHLVTEHEDQVFTLVISPAQGRAWFSPGGEKR